MNVSFGAGGIGRSGVGRGRRFTVPRVALPPSSTWNAVGSLHWPFAPGPVGLESLEPHLPGQCAQPGSVVADHLERRADERPLAVRVVRRQREHRPVLARGGERRVRAAPDVDDRHVAVVRRPQLEVRPLERLAVAVLREGRRARLAVAAEADLDHLPVALVQADPEEVLVVVVVEEPVLEPGVPARLVHGAAVRTVGEARVGVQPPCVLDVAAAGGVEEVVCLHLVAVRVLLLAEELERQLLLRRPSAVRTRRRAPPLRLRTFA